MKINEVLQKENIGKKYKLNNDSRMCTVIDVGNGGIDLVNSEGYSVTHFNFLNYIINGEYTEVKTIKMNQIEYNVFKTIKDCGFLSCKGCALERYCSKIENNFKYKFGYTIGEIDENEIIIEVIKEEVE